MKTLGYYNGKIRDLEHSSIPMLDRGCYYGDGVFNVSYSRNRHIYEYQAHMDELYKSAKGVRITPPQNEYIYAGVGRALMLKECEKHGIPYEERPIMLDELFTADEVFRVSGSSLCMRVMEIDGKPVGGKDEKNLTILQNSLLEKFLRETE